MYLRTLPLVDKKYTEWYSSVSEFIMQVKPAKMFYLLFMTFLENISEVSTAR